MLPSRCLQINRFSSDQSIEFGGERKQILLIGIFDFKRMQPSSTNFFLLLRFILRFIPKISAYLNDLFLLFCLFPNSVNFNRKKLNENRSLQFSISLSIFVYFKTENTINFFASKTFDILSINRDQLKCPRRRSTKLISFISLSSEFQFFSVGLNVSHLLGQ